MASGPPPPAVEAPKDAAGETKAAAPAPTPAAAPLSAETNTLWVGNLPVETSDADVLAAFAPHGALDCATTRAGSRCYAFVLFRSAADARASLAALQGAKVNGAAIRNEFARPARAVRNLWVGGISPSISKEELEEEFLKFGKIECFSFFPDRNSAYVDFYKLEDAISAHRALNRQVMSGEELCVDFQRSKGRAEWTDASSFNSRVPVHLGSLALAGDIRGVHGSNKAAAMRMREAAQPSNVLWIGFPNGCRVTEEALRRAMAAHGEVTKTKIFPARNYAFVEFATTEEACNAKKNLDGRLFNDDRVLINFSSSGIQSYKFDNATPFAGMPGSDMFVGEDPYGTPDYSSSGETMAYGNIRGTLPPSDIPVANSLTRPYGSHGFDPLRGRSGHFDYNGVHSAGGILPSPDPRRPFSAAHGAWGVFDAREAKRMRLDANASDADPYHVRAGSEGLGYPAGFTYPDRAVPVQRSLSPVIRGQVSVHRTQHIDHYWRGSIAKGGAHVCYARCVSIGKGIEVPLPDTVNCSARTGLDQLTRHYADATGFDIVFFLPDSEADFAHYTELLRYLGSKSRAGVVKVDAKTTLFLVPPSDFLTDVLQVDGPERLYGVVLHMPQISASTMERPQLAGQEPLSYYDEEEAMSTSQRNHSVIPHNIDSHLDADYRGSLHEGSLHHLGQIPARPRADEDRAAQSALGGFPTRQTAGPQVEVALRPDIMASLAKLVPVVQPSDSGTGQVLPVPTDRPGALVSQDASMVSQGWKHGNQGTALNLGAQQFSKQAPVTHLPNYGNLLGAQEHSAQAMTVRPNFTPNLPPPPPPPTRPPNPAVMSSQGGQYFPSQSQQLYEFEQYYAPQSSYGLLTANAASNISLPAPPPHQLNPAPLPANNQMENYAQPQNVMPLPTEMLSLDVSQGQQQQTATTGTAQTDDEAERNRKYQATLQFAATLLRQLQQQQPGAAQSAQGSGNQP